MVRILLALFLIVSSVSCAFEDPPRVADVYDASVVARGQSLAKGVAACGFCHGQNASPDAPLVGGRSFFDRYGEVRAANLTPSESGVRRWSTSQIMEILRGGGERYENISWEVHRGYEWMADSDLFAVASYIKSLPPIDNEVSRRGIGFLERNTTGMLDVRRANRGYVPTTQERNPVEFGRYLVDHVARCGLCHTLPKTVFSDERYLAGGKTIVLAQGERVAPGITASQLSGVGSWSEKQIGQYLRTGVTPEGESRDPDFCPTPFYARASNEQISAMAAYLKTVQ